MKQKKISKAKAQHFLNNTDHQFRITNINIGTVHRSMIQLLLIFQHPSFKIILTSALVPIFNTFSPNFLKIRYCLCPTIIPPSNCS